MGREAVCAARVGRKADRGKATLESDHLLFRGNERVRIAFTDITSVAANNGWLVLQTPAGEARFEIGDAASKWADAIANPKTRIEKLGIKPGMRVSVLRIADGDFAQELSAAGADVSTRRRKESDALFVGIESRADLELIGSLEASIKRNGAIWTVSPKGRKDLREAEIYEVAHAAELTDVKVVKFSETHTANKFVIPVARR